MNVSASAFTNKPRVPLQRAAEVLGVSPWTLRSYVKQRRLAHYRLGGKLWFAISELDRFVTASEFAARDAA